MTNVKLTSMQLKTKPVRAEAFRWGPGWDTMMDTAAELGKRGQMFELVFASEEDERRGVDILPEMVLLDYRYRKHVVTQDYWIVVHPGTRNFRILTEEQVYAEYEVE